MGNDVTGGAYGLTANPSGSFNGSAMTLFYGPSTWPSLSATLNPDATPCWAKHGPGCTWDQSKIWANVTVTANGGVPQAGDIGVHKAAVAELVKAKIPDPDFVRPTATLPLSPWGRSLTLRLSTQDGIGIFDWESWRALFSENYDSLSYSNYYSTLLVKKREPPPLCPPLPPHGSRAFRTTLLPPSPADVQSIRTGPTRRRSRRRRSGSTTRAPSCSSRRRSARRRSCAQRGNSASMSTRWTRPRTCSGSGRR